MAIRFKSKVIVQYNEVMNRFKTWRTLHLLYQVVGVSKLDLDLIKVRAI